MIKKIYIGKNVSGRGKKLIKEIDGYLSLFSHYTDEAVWMDIKVIERYVCSDDLDIPILIRHVRVLIKRMEEVSARAMASAKAKAKAKELFIDPVDILYSMKEFMDRRFQFSVCLKSLDSNFLSGLS